MNVWEYRNGYSHNLGMKIGCIPATDTKWRDFGRPDLRLSFIHDNFVIFFGRRGRGRGRVGVRGMSK